MNINNLTINALTNKAFLDLIDTETRETILSNIANHYGISNKEAYIEVTDSEAEHLLDYVTGNEGLGVSVLMQRQGLA